MCQLIVTCWPTWNFSNPLGERTCTSWAGLGVAGRCCRRHPGRCGRRWVPVPGSNRSQGCRRRRPERTSATGSCRRCRDRRRSAGARRRRPRPDYPRSWSMTSPSYASRDVAEILVDHLAGPTGLEDRWGRIRSCPEGYLDHSLARLAADHSVQRGAPAKGPSKASGNRWKRYCSLAQARQVSKFVARPETEPVAANSSWSAGPLLIDDKAIVSPRSGVAPAGTGASQLELTGRSRPGSGRGSTNRIKLRRVSSIHDGSAPDQDGPDSTPVQMPSGPGGFTNWGSV